MRQYQNGDIVTITKGMYAGNTATVEDYNPRADEYLLRNNGNLWSSGFIFWADISEFYPVSKASLQGYGSSGSGYSVPKGIRDEWYAPPSLNFGKQKCRHEWKGTLLIMRTVFDCSKCGIKKEDYDKEQEELPF